MKQEQPAAFLAVLAKTLKQEGGYVNDPYDSGGETYRGISRRAWPSWKGWPLIDQAKTDGLKSPKAIDRHFEDDAEMFELVADFYFANFWQAYDE